MATFDQCKAASEWMALGWASEVVFSEQTPIGGPSFLYNTHGDMIMLDNDGRAYKVDPQKIRETEPLVLSARLPF